MRRRRQGIVIIIILTAMFLGGPAVSKNETLYNQLKLVADTLVIIQKQYVEEADTQKIINGALKGMLASLDPNSQFMDADLYEELRIHSRGHFGGLGMTVTVNDHFLTVISPLEDTPASRAGMQPGDIIMEIEGQSTKDMSLMEAVKLLRGKAGTEVKIIIIRDRKVLPDMTLIREKIELPAVKEAYMIDEEAGIGYVRLVEFREDTDEELEKALKDLEAQNVKSLILDLRGNPGGLLEAAVEVVDKFIAPGKMIVYTRGRTAASNQDYLSREEPHPRYPLAILVNGYSASASEIVAGAIQDWERGIVIGTKTFGKATVQTVIPLSGNSAMRLTTAKYFTPKGRSINEDKIVPDVVVEREITEQERNSANSGDETAEQNPLYIGKEKDEPIEEIKTKNPLDIKEEKKVYDNQLIQAINILKAWPAFKAIMEGNENAG